MKIKASHLKSLIKEIVAEVISGLISESSFHEHKEWMMYEGEEKITTIFEDNSRMEFPIRFGANRGEDKYKCRHKAASKWKSLAREIYTSTGLSESGNPIVKPWKVCFQEALNDPEMKEFILKDHNPVF
jgi:hypothetical protein